VLPVAQLEDFVRDPGETSGCVQDNGVFCFDWAADNIDRYWTPLLEHIVLVTVSVAAGFVIALGLALASHRHRWLVPPAIGVTGILYTIPSLAFFFLLLPITGRGMTTAIIALTAYTLQIIYRNMITGLDNVPVNAKDAGRGMGMTERQLLWRVEIPLALPEILAGVRIAIVSTVAIATLAVFAGGGGLGEPIFTVGITFRTGVAITAVLTIGLAIVLDLLVQLGQRRLMPWRLA
jgi:osmoprotectant transport system permease protein